LFSSFKHHSEIVVKPSVKGHCGIGVPKSETLVPRKMKEKSL
jgi:hypothetical protein